MRSCCTFLLFFGLFSNLFAQNNFWTPMKPEVSAVPDGLVRKIKPLKIETFQLNYPSLKAVLAGAPMEFTAAARQHPVALSLPLADGTIHTFNVWESPVMAPELLAKFPEIRTYAGTDAEGLGLSVRLGIGDNGLHAFIFNQNGKVQSVRPYADGTDAFYMTYRLEDLPRESGADGIRGACGVTEGANADNFEAFNENKVSSRTNAEQVTLRKYRLAVSTQGEYAQYHGGTKVSVMNAIVEAVNFIVAIQERDWAVRLELIPNNDTLIYFDPATDPFSGQYVSDWIYDNPAAINSRISVNSYDMAHLFARVSNPSGVYVAGKAALAGVCTQINKAVAGASLPNPVGEFYYLIIAHEMGHQFSATHTFNSCPPSQDAQTPETAYEPGGGSTIMSYGTTCDPDIVGQEETYYHVASIEQAMNFITVGVGQTCAVSVDTDNHAPEVSIPLTNGFFIPISTPFVLKGNANDADGDNLTYCWEEFDLGPIASLGQPIGNSPIFRSYFPVSSPDRTFPRMSAIVTNQVQDVEVLPTYSRALNFKLTARDNHAGGGGVGIAAISFRAAASAGPFLVTYPSSSGVSWKVGEYHTITWDVANTNAAPVNCKKVNIRLSTDGGFNYPILLAEGVPNNGKYCIQVPNNVGNNRRIRVEAADNIFFDISNANFAIQQPSVAAISLCPAEVQDYACLPGNYTTQISTVGLSNVADPITLSATGLPNGATATFSPNPVQPGSSSTMTVVLPGNSPENTFDVTVQGNAGTLSATSVITLTVVNNDFSAFAPTSPANGAAGVNKQPVLHWSAVPDANTYEVELATNPSFTNSVLVASLQGIVIDSFQVPQQLEEGKVYYWRVRPNNDCGPAAWSDVQVFVVGVQSCGIRQATDLPKNITANGTPTVESKITLTSGGPVSDLNIKKIQGNHSFFKDLEVRLIGPTGTDVLLWKDKCPGYNGQFNIAMDDAAAGTFACPPPNNGVAYKPAAALTAFNGQSSAGVWTLRVKDNVISSGGSLAAFELEICSNVALDPPIIVTNSLLTLAPGTNASIGDNLLKAQDANNGPDQLTFTLMSLPAHGQLLVNGATASVGSQFTQADISSGGLRYFDYGLNLGQDHFDFSVTDGAGGLASGKFLIQPFTVGTHEAQTTVQFDLAPNPATSVAVLSLSQALDSDARVTLYNAVGQVVSTWQLSAGAYSLRLELASLPKGVYAVALENTSVKSVKKLVVH